MSGYLKTSKKISYHLFTLMLVMTSLSTQLSIQNKRFTIPYFRYSRTYKFYT